MNVLDGYYVIIGGGPSGLAAARNLQRKNIPFIGFEAHSDVGLLKDVRIKFYRLPVCAFN